MWPILWKPSQTPHNTLQQQQLLQHMHPTVAGHSFLHLPTHNPPPAAGHFTILLAACSLQPAASRPPAAAGASPSGHILVSWTQPAGRKFRLGKSSCGDSLRCLTAARFRTNASNSRHVSHAGCASCNSASNPACQHWISLRQSGGSFCTTAAIAKLPRAAASSSCHKLPGFVNHSCHCSVCSKCSRI